MMDALLVEFNDGLEATVNSDLLFVITGELPGAPKILGNRVLDSASI